MTVAVTVALGGERYAIPVEHVREIGRLGDVTPVPGAGPAVLGVRNLHGRILPVFDLAHVLDVHAGATPTQLVVADVAGTSAGLAVDAVHDVRELDVAQGHPVSELLRGTVLVDGALVGVVDAPRLLAELEARSAA
jgi:purine-binding chemotaxis protein CheW